MAAGGPRGSSALAVRGKAVGAWRPCAAVPLGAMPAQNVASGGGERRAAGGSERRAGPGDNRARVVVAEPPGAEMGEQDVVITPAMLAEEEQLEAAGLEKERQMLEKVRGAGGLGGCRARGGSCRCRECAGTDIGRGTGLSVLLGSCLREMRSKELRIPISRGIAIPVLRFPLAVSVFKG